jgi:hypothetical protein
MDKVQNTWFYQAERLLASQEEVNFVELVTGLTNRMLDMKFFKNILEIFADPDAACSTTHQL